MEERKAPPLVTLSDQGRGKSGSPDSLTSTEFKWPPPGWPMFSCVTETSGTAFCTNARHGEDDFLEYRVSCSGEGVYVVEIFSGNVGRNGMTHTPVIGMRFAAREDWFDENPGKAVLDIHVRGQRLIPERGAVLRVILAMTFIISRIDRGLAPSLKRVLKTYRL